MSHRMFIAGELPDFLRRHLTGLTRRLAQSWPAGPVRWGAVENLHLTLRFLGDTAPSQLPELKAALESCCTGQRPLALTLHGIGAFPDLQHPRVIWAGLRGETESLHDLQRRLEARLQGLGWAPEPRPFRPHLTLGRLRAGAWCGDDRWARITVPAVDFTIEAITLVESRLAPEGATYRALHRYSLSP